MVIINNKHWIMSSVSNLKTAATSIHRDSCAITSLLSTSELRNFMSLDSNVFLVHQIFKIRKNLIILECEIIGGKIASKLVKSLFLPPGKNI